MSPNVHLHARRAKRQRCLGARQQEGTVEPPPSKRTSITTARKPNFEEALGDVETASTLVVVKALANPDMSVEIEAVAASVDSV